MKYEYGVICIIKANGKLHIQLVNVIAESETDAKKYAAATIEAQGLTYVCVGMDFPNIRTGGTIKGIQNNGLASNESIKEFENFCNKFGVKIS